MFKPKQASQQAKAPRYDTVVLEPSYNLQLALLAIAGAEAYAGWYPAAAIAGLLGVLLTVQAQRVKYETWKAVRLFVTAGSNSAIRARGAVWWQGTRAANARRFVFDDEALEVKIDGQESDNVVVGGRNRWPYDSFMNWKLFWPPFPVLVYYKVRCGH